MVALLLAPLVGEGFDYCEGEVKKPSKFPQKALSSTLRREGYVCPLTPKTQRTKPYHRLGAEGNGSSGSASPTSVKGPHASASPKTIISGASGSNSMRSFSIVINSSIVSASFGSVILA